jgi:Holliday junction resolvasome RuvABC endonuclease subunit
MRFVGIDPAASKGIALVSIGEAKSAIVHTSPVFKVSEAQRLVAIRQWVNHHTPKSSVCVLVEKQFQGKILPAIAAVCVEGSQAAAPGAVVLEMMPSSWRLAVSGSGRMSKEQAILLAAEYGVPAQDDLAEALCMAVVARRRWREATDGFT